MLVEERRSFVAALTKLKWHALVARGRKTLTILAMIRSITTRAIALTPVQETSLLVAYWRMLETGRSSMKNAPSPSLMQDEFASILVDKLASKEILEKYKSSPFLSIGINCLAIRTRVIDDWLLSRGDSPRQIVNLGAGMCTRPYRLYFGDSTVVYEVDDPDLLKAKRQVLREAGHEPRGKVVDVAGDVTEMEQLSESLVKNGYDSSLPTDWIGEGLFAYLDPPHHLAVLKGAKHLGGRRGSRFIFTAADPFCQDYVVNMMGVEMPWAGLRPIPDVVEELKDSGWSKDVTVLGDDDYMQMFQRTVTLPIFLVMAEAADDAIT